MMEALTGLLDVLLRTGPYGVVLASSIVGLALALIFVAHFRGLWGDLGRQNQSAQLQAKMLELIATLKASEDASQRRIDELSRDKATLQEDVDDMRVQIALLRSQRRRLIDMMRHLAPPPKALEAA